MKVIRKYSDPEGLKQSLSHYPDIVRFIQKEWLALFDCILQLKNAEFGGQFMQNTANINTKEFRKTSCWIEHGAVGSFLR